MRTFQKGMSTLAVVLLIILIVILLGGLPLGVPYAGSGLIFLVLIVVLILAVMWKL